MWPQLVSIGILAGIAIYNELTGPAYTKPTTSNELQLPTTADGAPYPLIYGRCRIRKPVLTWCDTPVRILRTAGTQEFWDYYLSMHLVLGLPFPDGEQHIYTMWAGDGNMRQIPLGVAINLGSLVGDGNFEDQLPSNRKVAVAFDSNPNGAVGTGQVLTTGVIEFLNGHSNQLLVDAAWPYGALTHVGQHMTVAQTVDSSSTYGLVDPRYVGSYRGALSVFLHGGGACGHWYVGTQPTAQAYSFDVASYPAGSAYPSQGIYQKIGIDANPVDVIYDVLTNQFGRLGLNPTTIDMPSFQAAAYTLWTEGHGYSRCVDQSRTGIDLLHEILVQIWASFYEDPTTGLLGIRLIRHDYDPRGLVEINITNCARLENVRAGGWVGVPNKVRITFTNSQDDYNPGSATAQNLAQSAGQDGVETQVALDMPGVTTLVLARAIAERELAARSAPLTTCTAVVDRSFATMRPGDVVKVAMTDPDIAGSVFRVVAVNRGSLADGKIKLDLVSDFYFVWRGLPPETSGFGGHTIGGGLLTSGG